MNFQIPETPAYPTIDLTGQKLGDYQILRRLGSGGMADVYLAKQHSLNRNVALKILRSELAKDDSYVQRFRQEAQAAANLTQYNIVQIYEVGESEGYYFIAQEYIQGRNLRQYLDRHGAVEPVMAINVLRQCSMALQKAGALHVIHRDIKPENIMLSTKGDVKITDFGLARINNNAAKQALTQIGITMGTPLYMSPEQVEGGAVDQRSDIYSLGVTAYHMLAGKPPFDGDNALAIAVQHAKNTPPSLAELRPDVPLELCQIINRMMAKLPQDRQADAGQLLKELRRVKIDVDDDWEMIVEKLSVAETERMTDTASWSQSKLAATRQLQAVMRGNVRNWWNSRTTILSLILLSILGIAAGVMYAQRTVPDSLLNVQQISASEVPKYPTANEQLEAAFWAPRDLQEKYWLAVLDYFPPEQAPELERYRTQYVFRTAKERLAEYYLVNGQPDKALPIYNEFVGYVGLAAEYYRIVGNAGQAIVYSNMPAADFAGGADEKNEKIRASIGGVGAGNSQLNEFMAERFLKVKNEKSGQPEPGKNIELPESKTESRLYRFLRRFAVV